MSELNVSTKPEDVQQFVDIFSRLNWQTILGAAVTLVVGIVIVKTLLRLIKKGIVKTNIPETLHSVLITLIRIMLYLVLLLTVASQIGIPITSFVTIIGVAGLAVSMAVQGILQSLAGGMILLGSKPFDIGDAVETDGIAGIVKNIHMMNTQLETFDGKSVYIPNSKLYSSTIINYTRKGQRRVEMKFSASYDAPPALVREAVMEAVNDTPGVLAEPAPRMLTENYADSAIEYTLWVWCNASDFVNVKYGISEKLYDTYRKHNVEMTYPHLNIHMKDEGDAEIKAV